MFGSIRLKLTAWYVALLAITLVLFSAFLYFFLSKRLSEGIDNSLKVSASVVAKTALMKYASTPLPGLNYFFEQFLGHGNLNKFYRIYDGSGNMGSRSRNVDASQFPLTQEAYTRALEGEITYETFTVADDPIRVITMPVRHNNDLANLVQVGTSLQSVNETMKNLRIFLYTAVPAILGLATFVGIFMARHALNPVANITQTARDIGGGDDLSKRIPVPAAQDEIGLLAVTFNDMLERLENSFAQVRQFSSDASHELRTPLTVLKGQSELTLSKDRNSREYQEVLSSNLEEVNYMSKVLDDLFLLAKADEKKIQLDCKPVQLDSIVEEACKHAQILGDEKKLEIVLAYVEPVEIYGNAVRLRQMIWNLLHNGIKYTPAGGKIKVSLEDKDNGALLTVEDNGIGIPEKQLPFIFDRFYRVDKARSKSEGGSGLGLSICKHIVESHKGRIEVESQVDAGTKFKISFPKVEAAKSLNA